MHSFVSSGTGRILILVLVLVALGPVQAQKKPVDPRRQVVPTDLPPNVTLYNDMIYTPAGEGEMALDLYMPRRFKDDEFFPTILVVHGGGWAKKDKESFRHIAQYFVPKGYVAASVDYTLCDPDPSFPRVVHELKAAVRWLRANAELYRVDVKRIGVIGGSAGGHLAALLGTSGGSADLEGDLGHAGESSGVQAVCVMAGPVDLTSERMIEMSRKSPKFGGNVFLGKTYDQDPRLWRIASPIHYVDHQDPPFLFMDGEEDRPGERYVAMRKRMDAFGISNELVVIKEGPHGMWNRVHWFEETMGHVVRFFDRELKN